MDNKVMIENLSSGRVLLKVPDLNLKRVFERKGAKKPVDAEILQQAMYDPGVEYLFTQGILGINDLDQKKYLGLEPEDAVEPENIIILTDTQKKRLLTVAPMVELKDMLKKLPYEQIQALVDYAIANELLNMDRCELLKKYTQIDIINAVKLNREMKEG